MKNLIVKRKIVLIAFLVLLLIPINVYAHPGRTDSSGCHTCRTNCASWGLKTGEYHCHNSGTTSSKKSSNNSSNNTTSSNNKSSKNTKTTVTKSNNANLGTLKIDDENIEINDTMYYSTSNETPTITGTTAHSKATLKINKPDKLSSESVNEISIVVTAEDSTTKEYKLYITLLSSDATLKTLEINNNEIEINDTMSFETTESQITINAIANDSKADIVYDKEYDLDIGYNNIIIKVIAEDKTTKEYTITVLRNEIIEEKEEIEQTQVNTYQDTEKEDNSNGSIIIMLIIIILSIIFIFKKVHNKS